MKVNAALVVLVASIEMSFGQGSIPPCMVVRSVVERQNREVVYYQQRYGTYPDSLAEMCEVMHPSEECAYYLFDYWGRPFSYAHDQSGFELYSNGPDGLPNTPDDVTFDSSIGCAEAPTESGSDKFKLCPCWQTARMLMYLDYDIKAFYYFRNEYPRKLDELDMYFRGGLPSDTTIDAWAEPYRYSLTQAGYVLYSTGPDRQPNTDDDVYPWIPPDKCVLSLVERAAITLSLLDIGIALFHHAKREYPTELVDLDVYFNASWLGTTDPWRERYQYAQTSAGYELYSCGPDTIPDTEDDVFPKIPCRLLLSDSPGDILTILDLGIKLFQFSTNRTLHALADLDAYFSKDWLDGAVDLWGEPYRLSPTSTGYILYSSGPDRLPGTDDDIFPTNVLDRCIIPLENAQHDNLLATRKPQSGCGCSVRNN